MFYIRRPEEKSVTIIRPAERKEYAAYELKRELGKFGPRKAFIVLNNPKVTIDTETKELGIEVSI